MYFEQDDGFVESPLPLLQDDEAQRILKELCEKHGIDTQTVVKLKFPPIFTTTS